jgi:hypothetical protein
MWIVMSALRWRTQEVNEECALCQQEMSLKMYICQSIMTCMNFSSAVKELCIHVALTLYIYSLYNLNIKELLGIKLHMQNQKMNLMFTFPLQIISFRFE